MKCIQLQRRKSNAKEKGARILSPYNDTPCGKCGQCLTNLGNQWKMRLDLESKTADNVLFIGLSYQDSELPYEYQEKIHVPSYFLTGPKKPLINQHWITHRFNEPTITKHHAVNYIKRLRKYQSSPDFKKKWARICKRNHIDPANIKEMRYYLVGEYGGKYGRPHYHIILYNCYKPTQDMLQSLWSDPNTNNLYGRVDIQIPHGGALDYVSKFHINKHAITENPKNKIRQIPFSLMSKNLGLKGVLNQKAQIYATDKITVSGIPYGIPQTFKDKLYPSEWAQIDLKSRKQQFAEMHHLKEIAKLKQQGFKKPLLEIENRQEALNKKLIKQALKH